jgi:hypothetical protein
MKIRILSIAAIGVALAIFVVEGTLAQLRQRNLEVTIEITDAQGKITTTLVAPSGAETPTAAPGAVPSVLTLKPDDSLRARVAWDYRIGPRFQITVVHAEVSRNDTHEVVASDDYTIDCGSAPLQCQGATILLLDFAVKGDQGTRAPWPTGDYTLRVTRTYVGFKPVPLTSQPIRIEA